MLRWVLLGMILAGAATACGGPCDAGGGVFAGARVPAPPTLRVEVLVDAGNTVVVEVISEVAGEACAMGSRQTTRLVWEAAQRRLTATTAVPSSGARRLSGAMLGGGVTTWENVPPNLTIRALTDAVGNLVINVVEPGMAPVAVTCVGAFMPVCT